MINDQGRQHGLVVLPCVCWGSRFALLQPNKGMMQAFVDPPIRKWGRVTRCITNPLPERRSGGEGERPRLD